MRRLTAIFAVGVFLCVAGIAIPAARFALQEGHFKFEQAPKIFNRRVAFPMTRIVNHERAIFP